MYGAALIGGGLLYAALYSVTWLMFDQPVSWLDTPYGPFGRFVAAWGLLLFFFAPDMILARWQASRWSIGAVLAALAVAAALILGIQIGRATSLSSLPAELRLGKVSSELCGPEFERISIAARF